LRLNQWRLQQLFLVFESLYLCVYRVAEGCFYAVPNARWLTLWPRS
jgi:hypothetical protein